MITSLLVFTAISAVPARPPASIAPLRAAALELPAEVKSWISEHTHTVETDSMRETLGASKSIVIASPTPAILAARIGLLCCQSVLARERPVLLCLPASWDEGRAMDDFLVKSRGDATALLEKSGLVDLLPQPNSLIDLGHVWNSDAKHKLKLRVAGIDYRKTQEAASGLTEFLGIVEPELSQRPGQLLSPFRQVDANGHHRYEGVLEDFKASVRTMLEEVTEWMKERKDTYVQATNAQEYATAARRLAFLRQAEAECSKAAGFRRGRALCENAARARTDLGSNADLLLYVDEAAGLESKAVHETLGDDALLILLLVRADAAKDPVFEALSSARVGGALDLRELPKEGAVAEWFGAQLTPRADIVIWAAEKH